jgi:Flp pilus assembly protein TadB
MFASHLILGVTLISFSLWLQRTEGRGWPNETYDSELDAEYLRRRKRSRRRVNLIFAFCGTLILVAGVSGPRVFVVAWMTVTVALLTVMMLAAVDVVRTQRYQQKKLPEIRRQLFDNDD